MEKQIIEMEHLYAHAIQDVWNAISRAEEISKWFIQADFEPRVGYDYTFTHESSIIKGTVMQVDPPRLLVYSWKVSGVETTVTWQLEEADEGTRLRLVHSGIEKHGEHAAKMLASFTGGWEHCISELEEYLTPQNA